MEEVMELTHEKGGLAESRAEVLERYDASHLVGLNVVVMQAARRFVDEHGNDYVEVPWIDSLVKSAAVVRCLMPVRLKGAEMKAIRKILGLTGKAMAKRLQIDPATYSRWENDAQAMGGYAEKIFRLVACEELKDAAPAVSYDAKMIAALKVFDPVRSGAASWEVPPIVFSLVKMKVEDGHGAPEIRDEWSNRDLAA